MSVIEGSSAVSTGMLFNIDASNPKSYNSSENLYTYSEDFSQTDWSKGASVTLTSNSGIAPDYTNTADKIVLNVGWSGQIPVYRSISTLALNTYTESFYVKAAGWNYAYLWFDNGSGFGATLEIDLSTGAIRNTRTGNNTYYTGFSTSVVNVGNGWYRISISATTTALGTSVQFRIYPSNVAWVSGNFGTPSPTGDGVNGIYIWGGQFEKSDAMSSYTKTTTTAITRSTLISDISGNNNSGTLTNGVSFSPNNSDYFVFDGTDDCILGTLPLIAANSSITIEAMVKLNSLASTVNIFTQGQTAVSFSCGMVVAGATLRFRNSIGDATLSSAQTLVTGQWYHLVLCANTLGATGYVNGVSNGTTTQKVVSNAVTSYAISQRPGGSSEYVNGNISMIKVYSKELSSAEVLQNFNALRGRYGI